MELGEIFRDSLSYPLQNIKSFIIYLILGIIAGIVVGGTLAAAVFSIQNGNVLATIGSGVIGIVVAIFLGFVISGYELDIIKYGINRDSSAPEIDLLRHFFNSVKLFALSIVYYIIPVIIVSVLSIFFRSWIILIVAFILFVIFGLAQFMAQCRLAKTEDFGYALAIGEAIGDISKIGFIKLLLFLIIVVLISLVLFLIAGFITELNATVGGIIMGILGIYLVFFISRASGLLYSEV